MPPTARAHAVGTIADTHDLGASWRTQAYTAFWSHGADINDVTTLVDLAGAAGLPPEKVAAALADNAFLASIRRAAGRHRRSGVGGVPTILAQRTLIPGLLSEDELRELGAYS
jgi:predicted DsbA family dithiol-disulfide isomerase